MAAEAQIVLKRVGRSVIDVPIVGTAPLIVHQFGEKARHIMLAAQMGEVAEREPKNPDQLYKDSMYPLDPAADGTERYGFPAVAFKAAIINGARFFKGSKLTMEGLKASVFVQGEGSQMLVPLLQAVTTDAGELIEQAKPAEPRPREDTVRNASGVADIRFRGEYWPWSAMIRVVYVTRQLTAESVVNLVDAAGLGGVGEWRPSSKTSKTGVYGTWSVPEGVSIQARELK